MRKTKVRHSPHLAGTRAAGDLVLIHRTNDLRGRYFDTRSYKGLTIGRFGSPSGQWAVIGKPKLGLFTTLPAARGAVDTLAAGKRRAQEARSTDTSVHTVRGGLPTLGKRR